LREVPAVGELRGEVTLLEQFEGRLGRLAGDVLAGDALAPADAAVVQADADEDVVGLGPGVGGVLDPLLERDANDVGRQFRDFHRESVRTASPVA
jgi:hypothetical protein